MPDHIHVLVKTASTVPPAALAQQVKGTSSRLVGDEVAPEIGFGWQEGYGVFSVSRSHVERVKAYVLSQEVHHASGNIWAEWEETDEEVEPG